MFRGQKTEDSERAHTSRALCQVNQSRRTRRSYKSILSLGDMPHLAGVSLNETDGREGGGELEVVFASTPSGIGTAVWLTCSISRIVTEKSV